MMSIVFSMVHQRTDPPASAASAGPALPQSLRPVEQGDLLKIGAASYCVLSTPEAAANAGIVVGDRAILVVDTRLSPSLGADLKAAALEVAGDGERELLFVNTHAHGDHIFGNSQFAGLTGISTRFAQDALARDETWRRSIDSFSSRRPYLREQLEGAAQVAPTIGFDGTLVLDLGGVSVELVALGKAHTPGDLIVRVPSDNVVYTADLLYNGHWPVLTYGDYDTWMKWLDLLIADDQDYYVPGHGPGGGVEVVQTVRDSWSFLLEQARTGHEGAELAQALDASPYSDWLHRERIPGVLELLRERNV